MPHVSIVSESKSIETSNCFSCVVIGDSLVGKTSFIRSSVNASPSITENGHHLSLPVTMGIYEKNITVDNKDYMLIIHDADCQKNKREMMYTNCDLIILCYSTIDVASLRNVGRKWFPELKEFAVDKPVVLVGCKSDMREAVNSYMETVGEFDGMHMSTAIKSQAWFECSAKTIDNVNRVFEEVPICIERHQCLKAQKLNVGLRRNSNPVGSSPYEAGFFGSVKPILKQSYENLVACWSNPGAFVEKKKAIVSYIPILKRYIPYEEEAPATHHFSDSIVKAIEQSQLKHLYSGKNSKVKLQTKFNGVEGSPSKRIRISEVTE